MHTILLRLLLDLFQIKILCSHFFTPSHSQDRMLKNVFINHDVVTGTSTITVYGLLGKQKWKGYFTTFLNQWSNPGCRECWGLQSSLRGCLGQSSFWSSSDMSGGRVHHKQTPAFLPPHSMLLTAVTTMVLGGVITRSVRVMCKIFHFLNVLVLSASRPFPVSACHKFNLSMSSTVTALRRPNSTGLKCALVAIISCKGNWLLARLNKLWYDYIWGFWEPSYKKRGPKLKDDFQEWLCSFQIVRSCDSLAKTFT